MPWSLSWRGQLSGRPQGHRKWLESKGVLKIMTGGGCWSRLAKMGGYLGRSDSQVTFPGPERQQNEGLKEEAFQGSEASCCSLLSAPQPLHPTQLTQRTDRPALCSVSSPLLVMLVLSPPLNLYHNIVKNLKCDTPFKTFPESFENFSVFQLVNFSN